MIKEHNLKTCPVYRLLKVPPFLFISMQSLASQVILDFSRFCGFTGQPLELVHILWLKNQTLLYVAFLWLHLVLHRTRWFELIRVSRGSKTKPGCAYFSLVVPLLVAARVMLLWRYCKLKGNSDIIFF